MTKHTSHTKHSDDQRLDQIGSDSFPASDPPSHSGITGVRNHHGHATHAGRGQRKASHRRNDTERPTGLPNSDRHAMETAHSWEDEDQSG
jgi:hypothetical protein